MEGNNTNKSLIVISDKPRNQNFCMGPTFVGIHTEMNPNENQ